MKHAKLFLELKKLFNISIIFRQYSKNKYLNYNINFQKNNYTLLNILQFKNLILMRPGCFNNIYNF